MEDPFCKSGHLTTTAIGSVLLAVYPVLPPTSHSTTTQLLREENTSTLLSTGTDKSSCLLLTSIILCMWCVRLRSLCTQMTNLGIIKLAGLTGDLIRISRWLH